MLNFWKAGLLIYPAVLIQKSKFMKEKILLIGGGGHCRACIDVLEKENKFKIGGIVDKKELIGQKVLGYKVIASDEDLKFLKKDYKYAFISVGQLHNFNNRMKIFEMLKNIGFEIPIIVSPFAYISKYTIIEEGTIIMHHALINSNAKIGKNCIINTKSLIEHDAVIGDFCHISTGAIINGGVNIGSCTFIGSGTITKQYISIPDKSFIKAGSLIK